MATAKYRNDAARKLLERILSHPALGDGLPVRFRCDPSLTKPAIRCTRFGLSVWLPLSLAPCIPVLARFVRSLRRKPTVTIVVRTKPKETPKAPANGTPTNGTVTTAKPTPTNGARPVATAKANGTGKKPKARPKPPKPIPLWQREWDALWDRVARVLFSGPADRE
jgi:hypothetical protein